MSTPFSYGQLMPSVTKNYGSGQAEELTAHEYKTLWYAAAVDIEKLQQRVSQDEALLRQALDALEGFVCITNDSQGVAGYHLSGDTAEWDEFDEVDAASNTIEAIRNHLGVKS